MPWQGFRLAGRGITGVEMFSRSLMDKYLHLPLNGALQSKMMMTCNLLYESVIFIELAKRIAVFAQAVEGNKSWQGSF